jgi:hypothetical protein
LAPPPSCRRASHNSPRRWAHRAARLGCLLEELAGHCPPAPGVALAQLARRCLAPDPAARPFSEVEEALAGLKGRGQATPQIEPVRDGQWKQAQQGESCAPCRLRAQELLDFEAVTTIVDWGRRLGRKADRPAAAYRAAGSRPALSRFRLVIP